MHPYGGTPICPRCSKAVYLAEQAMGPGRKLYHKPCLACTICSKRLDSLTLLEHDQQPYCKSCHMKNFGTRDLRHANLPYAPPPGDEPAQSPTSSSSPAKGSFPPQALLRPLNTGGGTPSSSNAPLPRLRPNRSLVTSPISPTFPRGPSPLSPTYQMQSLSTGDFASRSSSAGTPPPVNNADSITEEEEEAQDAIMTDNTARNGAGPRLEEDHQERDAPGSSRDVNSVWSATATSPSSLSNTGRPGIGTIPRTIPLYLNGGNTARAPYKHHTSYSVGSVPYDYVTSAASYTPTNTHDAHNSNNTQEEEEEGEREEKEEGSFAARNITRDDGSGGIPLDRRGAFTSPGAFVVGKIAPLRQTATGTRYGVALGGLPPGGVGVHMTGQARKWGTGTPVCPRCMKSVYFAEQVKAVGKTFHKNCLRCMECNTSLDSNKLRDHDGDPFCVRCYNKLYGPHGGGYALLGKAGG